MRVQPCWCSVRTLVLRTIGAVTLWHVLLGNAQESLGEHGVVSAKADRPDFSSTVLVTYSAECLQEEYRAEVVSRSIRDVAHRNALGTHSLQHRSHDGYEETWDVVRQNLEENDLQSSASFIPFPANAKVPEQADTSPCGIRETWLKHASLQLLNFVGDCARIGKEDLINRLGKEECVLTREFDKPRHPSDMGEALPGEVYKTSAMRSRRPPFRALQSVPSDPEFYRQWHLDDTNPYSVKAQAAWQLSTGGSGSRDEQPGNTIGIVDFGFMEDHPDLKDMWWSNPDENCESIGKNGIDEDGNAKVDDCHGWNIARDSSDLAGYSHGTKVAGSAAASTDNNLGISGICRNCRILPATVSGSVSSELQGVNYVLSKGARVVNLSVGGGRSDAEYEIFRQHPNVLFVVSAGNENCDLDAITNIPCKDKYGNGAGFPASLSSELPNVLSVGAIQSNGSKSGFSSYGVTRVQVFAPGSGIVTTSYSGSTPTYSSRSGTSYAAPIVAGIAVLVRQKYPILKACQVREILVQSCVENSVLLDKAECNGQIDASAALQIAAIVAQNPTILHCSDLVRESLQASADIHRSAGGEDQWIRNTDSVEITGTSAEAFSTEEEGDEDSTSPAEEVNRNNRPTTEYTPDQFVKKLEHHGIMETYNAGEHFLEAMIAAVLKSGAAFEAHVFSAMVQVLLTLFTNFVDPFALLTNGKPVKKYLADAHKRLFNPPLYTGVAREFEYKPIDTLVGPLTLAKQYLDKAKASPQAASISKGYSKAKSFSYFGEENQADPLSFFFGLPKNILEPLIFGAKMGVNFLKPDVADLDPIELLLLKKQLKVLKIASDMSLQLNRNTEGLAALVSGSDRGILSLMQVLDPMDILRHSSATAAASSPADDAMLDEDAATFDVLLQYFMDS